MPSRESKWTRLSKLEQAQEEEDDPGSAWRYVDGLSARLMEAQALGLPQRDPWDLPCVRDAPGFGGLLWEARQQTPEFGP